MYKNHIPINLHNEDNTEEENENNRILSSVDTSPSPIDQSSPDKCIIKVRNPFEAALTDRLHLPLIASPSLFQRPATPPMSSTQFEWTIEEVSILKPANVEPHETQFQDSPDSELEARAQKAIITYFKEQQIVPSPAECELRNQRIILSELNNITTPKSTPGRRIRDNSTQTELTFPTILPETLEEALKSYCQPHLAGPNADVNFGRYYIHDTSLRRKLFDMHNIKLIENEENINDTPGRDVFKYLYSSPNNVLKQWVFAGKLSDSADKSSSASLSPFSLFGGFSPKYEEVALKRDCGFADFINSTDEILSPIQPPKKNKILNCTEDSAVKETEVGKAAEHEISKKTYSFQNRNSEIFYLESFSPLNLNSTNNINECSTDSFNIKISNLNVANTSDMSINELQMNKRHTSLSNYGESKLEQKLYPTGKDDSKRLIYTETPPEKRHLPSRKNLSHSFNSTHCLAEGTDKLSNTLKTEKGLAKSDCVEWSEQQQKATTTVNCIPTSLPDVVHEAVDTYSPRKNLTIHRTDSGFNDFSNHNTSCSNEVTVSEVAEGDPNYMEVVCCSTPTKGCLQQSIDMRL